jgi:hypothetical protein
VPLLTILFLLTITSQKLTYLDALINNIQINTLRPYCFPNLNIWILNIGFFSICFLNYNWLSLDFVIYLINGVFFCCRVDNDDVPLSVDDYMVDDAFFVDCPDQQFQTQPFENQQYMSSFHQPQYDNNQYRFFFLFVSLIIFLA